MKRKKEQNMKKDVFWNTLGSGINAFNSLFFMIIVTRINGIDDAGIFTFAFSTASLFNVIGIYSGRVYQVTDDSEIMDKDYFVHKIITCIMMLFISIGFLLVKNYSFWKGSIILALCLLKTFEAFSEVIYAFFQKEYSLYKVGVSFTIKNIFGLIIFLITDLITKNVFVSSSALLITYILVMIFYDFKNVNKRYFTFNKINWNHIWIIFKRGFFSFSLSFLTMYILNIPRYVIDANMETKFSTIFGILIMPASVMVLIAQFILHPFLMKLKECLTNRQIKEIKSLIKKMVAVISLISIFVLLIAYFLGIPVLELVYNIELREYKTSLMIVMIGAIMYGITIILSNILISMRVIFKQVLIYSVIAVISLLLSNLWIQSTGILGACQSYCAIMLISLVCFIGLIIISLKKIERNDLNAKN